jgi:hypothetical protein
MQVRSFLDVEARCVSWLWPGRLAAGNLALLEGDPGLGKSLLTLDLCARLIHTPADAVSFLTP